VSRAMGGSGAAVSILAALGAVAALGLPTWASAPEEETPPPARFTDVTQAAGIGFVHHNGATGEKLLPETMGGGVAFLDFDRDGDQDLLFVDSGRWPEAPTRLSASPAEARAREPTGGVVLYANDGSGHFRDVTAATGLERIFHGPGVLPFYGQGVAVGDLDGDGWPDLYVTAVGQNRLLRNHGGVFEDITVTTGTGGGDRWSTCAAFFDADGDGDLDLFVCNYLTWTPESDRALDRTVPFTGDGEGISYGRPQSYPGAHPLLFRNDTRSWGISFTQVAQEAGLFVDTLDGQPLSKALAVAPVDLDGDGRTDLVVTNDTTRNFVYHNLGPETGHPRFEEIGELFGLAYDPDGKSTGAMGIDWGYLVETGDGADDLAVLVGNFAHEHTSLYRAQGDPTFFADEALRGGLGAATRTSLTFGVLLFDYDLDGRLDLLQANGHVESDIDRIEPPLRHEQPPQLFWNTGDDPLLVELPADAVGDLERPLVGRGAAYADIDGDGDVDLVLTQAGGPPLLLRNDLEPEPPPAQGEARSRHWLRVRLVGRAPNRDALGALVTLETSGSVQRRQVEPARSYLSQVELPLTFGLGHDETVDRLVVTWPDGVREAFDVPGVDRLLVLERGHGARRKPAPSDGSDEPTHPGPG